MWLEMGLVGITLLVVVWSGARLTGRACGMLIGVLGSVLWAVVSLGEFDEQLSPLLGMVLGCGGSLLVIVGFVAGGGALHASAQGATAARATRTIEPIRLARCLEALSDLPLQFSGWLDQYRQHVDPWPAFEYHIRSVLRTICGACDVRAYRVLDDDLVVPLVEMAPHDMKNCIRVEQGVAGWVIRTRRSFCRFDTDGEGQWEDALDGSDTQLSWCFPVQRGALVVGVVTVGAFEDVRRIDASLLCLVAGMIGEQWGSVAEICRARVASITDHDSGLMTRAQFLRQAPIILEHSRRLSRPVTAAAIFLDGLHQLDEQGLWGLRDRVVLTVGRELRRRVKPQDCAARFNDSRFVMLWRDLDESGARRQVQDIVINLEKALADQRKWRQEVRVSAGICTRLPSECTLQSMLAAVQSDGAQVGGAECNPPGPVAAHPVG